MSAAQAGFVLLTAAILPAFLRRTTTRTGLTVTAHQLEPTDKIGVQVSPAEFTNIQLTRHDVYPELNYTIRPHPRIAESFLDRHFAGRAQQFLAWAAAHATRGVNPASYDRTNMHIDRPALLGGSPVRPAGPPAWPLQDTAVERVLADLAASGEWGRYHGPWCGRLVEQLAAMWNAEHVHLCCSGTAAVELGLRGIGVQPGDEVVMAAYDFKTNFTNVLHVGARPVLVDIRADDCQLDVSHLEATRSERTRCVIASHLHGGLVDLPALRAWAEPHGIAILEDACQAAGAIVAGRPAGMHGDVGVLSFGGSKLLTAGRGGALLTNRDDIAQRVKLIAHRGNDAYPLSEMQGAVLTPQVEQLRERHRRRADGVRRLAPELQRLGLRVLGAGTRPAAAGHYEPAFYKLGMVYDRVAFGGLSREQFVAAVRAEGIAIDAGFRALHRTHARSRFRTAGDLPHAEAAEASLVTLHHPVLLGGGDDLAEVVAAIEKVRAWSGELLAIAPNG